MNDSMLSSQGNHVELQQSSSAKDFDDFKDLSESKANSSMKE